MCPIRENISRRQTELQVCPDAYVEFVDREKWEEHKKVYKSIEYSQSRLLGLDMELAKPFYLPPKYSIDPAVTGRLTPVLAKAKEGWFTVRVRTAAAKTLLNVVYRELPEDGVASGLTKAACERRIKDRFYVDGGTQMGLGRLRQAYPAVGVSPRLPVTKEEAAEALQGCGLQLRHLPADLLTPFPLVPAEEQGYSVKINPHAENGFPVGGTWTTEGAAAKVVELAVALRGKLVAALAEPGGVWGFVREAEERMPYMVALKCKAKGDYYSTKKIENFQMRLYYVVGRQLVLNMQVASRVLEGLSRSIFMEGHSAQGITLTRGGAGQLVAKLDDQLSSGGSAFAHCGDDTWLAVRVGRYVLMFSLDCSNFDLTQHGAVTEEVHVALRNELRLVDPAAADLWFAIARERVVVTAGTLVRRWKHGGASGMVLQSKVNDMLMHVFVRRLMQRLHTVDLTSREGLEALVKAKGRDMGLDVRLEDYELVEAGSVHEALQKTPFLFLGYFFHALEGEVAVCCDLPRSLAQMQYPTLKWEKDKQVLEVREVMRLGSTIMNWGLPPRALLPAFMAARRHMVSQLQAVIDAHGDAHDEKLRWAVFGDVFGPEPEASLSGLLRALQRDPRELWLAPRPTAGPSYTMSWADQKEQEEEERVLAFIGRPYSLPPSQYFPPSTLVLDMPRATTHPATYANDGRPPPTARWLPDRPPQQGGGRIRRAGMVVFRPQGGWEIDESYAGSESVEFMEEMDTPRGRYHGWDSDAEMDEWLESERTRSPARFSDHEAEHWAEDD